MAAKKKTASPKPPDTEDLIPPEIPKVFDPRDLAQLEALALKATPEDFQKACATFFRRLLVKGLENIPVPKTIKEVQAVADLLRKAENLDGKGGPSGGRLVKPHTFGRGRASGGDKVVEAEVVESSPDGEKDEPSETPDLDDFEA